jgi:hypothetical protein
MIARRVDDARASTHVRAEVHGGGRYPDAPKPACHRSWRDCYRCPQGLGMTPTEAMPSRRRDSAPRTEHWAGQRTPPFPWRPRGHGWPHGSGQTRRPSADRPTRSRSRWRRPADGDPAPIRQAGPMPDARCPDCQSWSRRDRVATAPGELFPFQIVCPLVRRSVGRRGRRVPAGRADAAAQTCDRCSASRGAGDVVCPRCRARPAACRPGPPRAAAPAAPDRAGRPPRRPR